MEQNADADRSSERMHHYALIATLAGGLTVALVFGYITQRLRLSPIVGYLLGGVLIGPYTPGFVADAGLAGQLAEIGVILLMFGVGLQFQLKELLAVRRVAIPGAIAQSVAATVLGAFLARAMGASLVASVLLGMSLAVASTVVLIRVLTDNRALHTPSGHIAVGWLVVEDLLVVMALVLLPAVIGAGSNLGDLGVALLVALLKVGALVAIIFFFGERSVRWLLDRAAATGSRELFTLTVLVVALGVAIASAALFGVSMALGAFLAGLVVARSEFGHRAASEAMPMRDAFAVLFFVSVGMLLDPGYLLENPGIILAALAVVLVGKPLIAVAVVLLLRYPLRTALAVAVALAQIGEFSFILVTLGVDLGAADPSLLNVVVATAIISIILNPVLYRLVEPLARALERIRGAFRGRRPAGAAPATSPATDIATAGRGGHRAVIIGYGPTGQTLASLLRANSIEPTVVEMNLETVRGLKEQGLASVYGDASRPETLEAAGVARAGTFIITADLPDTHEVIRAARALNPGLHVLARTATLRDLRSVRTAGADEVFSGEGEVAVALIEATLQHLGATAEQIDRERDRFHRDLIAE
jgi:CPA2 family monovalent cation:H+ antiporter-2